MQHINQPLQTPGSYFASGNGATKTIAFFSQSPGGAYGVEKWWMWQGIMNAASERGVNVLYVAGSEINRDPHSVLYEILDKNRVDGILSWHSFVSLSTSHEELAEFMSMFAPTPIVTIENKLENYPAVLIDNYFGMRKLIDHLVSVHQFRRIAMLKIANWSSGARISAYEQIMQDYEIYDPALVLTWDDIRARVAAHQSGKPFGLEAVVAPLDSEATALLELFKANGIRVPEDVCVTGYNDGQSVRLSDPPITAVSLPFYRMGFQATTILLDQIAGRSVPSLTFMPLGLSVRNSCGCQESILEKVDLTFSESKRQPFSAVWAQRGRIIRTLLNATDVHHRYRLRVWINELLNTFLHCFSEPEPDHSVFENTLKNILDEFANLGEESMVFNNILSAMRSELVHYLENDMIINFENLFQRARVMVSQKAIHVLEHRNQIYLTRTEVIRDIERSIMLGQNYADFLEKLSDVLPRMDIPAFYLVTYANPDSPAAESRLLFAYQNGRTIPLPEGGILFPTKELLPSSISLEHQNNLHLIESLHVEEEQVGYLLFEFSKDTTDSEGMIYSIFSTQIGSAIKGIRLHDEIRSAWERAEEERELSENRRQAAEEANLLKSRFLSLVSHELRNPLNLIIHNAEMAKEPLNDDELNHGATPDLHQYLSRISKNASHLNSLISDVLDLTSSQMGKIELNNEPINMNQFMLDAADLASQIANNRGLECVIDIDENLPEVWGDPGRLRQVILNLLGNASKFTELGEIRLRAEKLDNQVMILISDTGIGIPEDEQMRIFDEFQQSERTSARGFGGMGLGLAISRKLIELHKGQIGVYSSGVAGEGSTFYFTLPAIVPNPELEQLPRTESKDFFYVFSDDAERRARIQQILRSNEYNVTTSPIPTDQLPLNLFMRPPSTILLDVNPLTGQGIRMIQRLSRHPKTREIPVIFLTLDHGNIGSLMPMAYVEKPMKAPEVVGLLNHFLNRQPRQTLKNRVMIVDDDQDILDSQAELIAKHFPYCEVSTAKNGNEGLDLMREHAPDLLLLDLMMPELDGFEVVTAMQEDPKLRNIPVIILTAQALTDEDMKFFEKGVVSVLQKGVIDADTLLARLDSIIKQETYQLSDRRHLVRRAIVYIHENHTNPIAREDIAKELGVNEDYLTHCFSEELGMPPNRYLNRYRIERSKQLLRQDPNMSVTNVALSTGFSSQSYFSRVFRKETGFTPREFRATIIGEK
ncbi:MAG: response regulator [Anaerolineaceae bacterium]|nr:response regulator [Anaerolineaceae bacterium]